MCHRNNHESHHNHGKHDGIDLLLKAVHTLKHIELHLEEISQCIKRWDEEDEEEYFCLCDEEDED